MLFATVNIVDGGFDVLGYFDRREESSTICVLLFRELMNVCLGFAF
jgi:hypothetical protein